MHIARTRNMAVITFGVKAYEVPRTPEGVDGPSGAGRIAVIHIQGGSRLPTARAGS